MGVTKSRTQLSTHTRVIKNWVIFIGKSKNLYEVLSNLRVIHTSSQFISWSAIFFSSYLYGSFLVFYLLSLELLFFAASKNITPWFFQVSSKSVYLNRTSFFNGYQEQLVRYRQPLNYSYVCKEYILKLSSEIQTSEQQLICCSGPFGELHGPQSLGRQEPCPVCVDLSPAGVYSAPSRPVWIWAASPPMPVCPWYLARGHCTVISPESQNLGAGRGLEAPWFSPAFSSQSDWGLQRKDASSGVNPYNHELYGWKSYVFVSAPKKKREACDFLRNIF